MLDRRFEKTTNVRPQVLKIKECQTGDLKIQPMLDRRFEKTTNVRPQVSKISEC
jgi:hypothetical protein